MIISQITQPITNCQSANYKTEVTIVAMHAVVKGQPWY